jgi:iron complex transport system substrate-binding protein
LPFIIIAGIIAIISLDYSSTIIKKEKKKQEPKRIISLSPNVTETLFALGLGNKVVGRTRFCNYPPEVKKIKEIGGYIDPNYEAIAALRPDIVILLPEHENVKSYLEKLNIHYLVVTNKNISDILMSIKIIGDSCNAQNPAKKLITELRHVISSVRAKTENLKPVRTLVSIGRNIGSGTLKNVYIAGKNTYFNELIELAGGINAFNANSTLAFPLLSAEGIIHLNPDIIIDLVPNLGKTNLTKKILTAEWNSLGNIDAIKNKRITVLSGDYTVIPGPRFVLLLQDLVKAIHPEINISELN